MGRENLASYQTGLVEMLKTPPMTLESLRGRLATNELQPRKTYEASLRRAQRVLQRKSGIAWCWDNVPVYALQDVHGNREMIVNFLGLPVPTADGSIPLFTALRQGKAKAVLLGDVAHSQNPGQWRLDSKKGLLVAKNELETTMNAQQMAFDLVAEFPAGQFEWISGNHDRQRKLPFGNNNNKNLAIARAMREQFGKQGEALHTLWTQTEDSLPLMFVNKSAFLSHGAPGADLDLQDVALKKDTAFEKLAGTENRQDVLGHMSEKEMIENMSAIRKQFRKQFFFEPDPNWVWVIGHKPTNPTKQEPDGFRMQCGDRLIQINQNGGQMYSVIHPDGRVFIGDCRSQNAPVEVQRNLALIS